MSLLKYIDEDILCIQVYLYVCMCIHTYTDTPQTKTIAHELKISLVKYRKGYSWHLGPMAKQQKLSISCPCPQLNGVFWICSGQSSDVFEPENIKLISRNSILTCLSKEVTIQWTMIRTPFYLSVTKSEEQLSRYYSDLHFMELKEKSEMAIRMCWYTKYQVKH